MSGTPRAARPQRARSRRFLLLLAAVVVAAIDLAVKELADARLRDTPVDLGLMQLRLAYNSGVAFSLGDALPTPVVVALTAAITAFIALYGWRHAPIASRIQLLAAGAIIGGAAANVIDRARDGVVTDYFHTGWWPTFNLADTVIVIGSVMLVLSQTRPRQKHAADAAPASDTYSAGGNAEN